MRFRPIFDQLSGVVHLYKLHGSVGWYEVASGSVRRGSFADLPAAGARLLMIPPQRRKASDTGAPPYSTLWSAFRNLLTLASPNIKRLFVLGYSMRDEHVNVILEHALSRPDFSMVILSSGLEPAILKRWIRYNQVVIVTANTSSLGGETGPGLPGLADFESFLVEARADA